MKAAVRPSPVRHCEPHCRSAANLVGESLLGIISYQRLLARFIPLSPPPPSVYSLLYMSVINFLRAGKTCIEHRVGRQCSPSLRAVNGSPAHRPHSPYFRFRMYSGFLRFDVRLAE